MSRLSRIFKPASVRGAVSAITRALTPHSAASFHTDQTRHSTTMSSGKGKVIPVKEVKRFIVECMTVAGMPEDHADEMSHVLVAADCRGHYSHGLNRLEMYVREVKAGCSDGSVKPEILKESPATAWVDGKNGSGFTVGNFCMNLAIKKAKEVGVGWVACKGSNHYGIAGWYSMMASKEGLIGMSCTNTSPFMAPTRAKRSALGTNPFTVTGPGKNGDDFVMDMATTAVAVGKLELKRRANEPLPKGWAVDEQGLVTQDAATGIDKGALMPLGGPEETSGYKGYALAAMVEIFCGILGGANFGPNVRRWGETNTPANLGQCFMAVNPDCFAPGFEDRMAELMHQLRTLEPVDPSAPVLVAGDPERQHIKEVEELGGIHYSPSLVAAMETLAAHLKVSPLKGI